MSLVPHSFDYGFGCGSDWGHNWGYAAPAACAAPAGYWTTVPRVNTKKLVRQQNKAIKRSAKYGYGYPWGAPACGAGWGASPYGYW